VEVFYGSLLFSCWLLVFLEDSKLWVFHHVKLLRYLLLNRLRKWKLRLLSVFFAWFLLLLVEDN
jgi:hypothetical protein